MRPAREDFHECAVVMLDMYVGISHSNLFLSECHFFMHYARHIPVYSCLPPSATLTYGGFRPGSCRMNADKGFYFV